MMIWNFFIYIVKNKNDSNVEKYWIIFENSVSSTHTTKKINSEILLTHELMINDIFIARVFVLNEI